MKNLDSIPFSENLGALASLSTTAVSNPPSLDKLACFFGSRKSIVNPPTLLEICGLSHRESVYSRILAFLLDTTEAHCFGLLFLHALISAYDDKRRQDQSKTPDADRDIAHKVGPTETVECEVVTFNDNRIDILLESSELVICIENKINASLYNDLCDYREYGEERARPENKLFVGIVLAPRHFEAEILKSSEFVCVTYSELADNVRSSIGEYVNRENAQFHYLLFDFLEQSKRLYEGHSMSEDELEFLDFWTDNEDVVQHVLDQQSALRKRIPVTVSSFLETLKKELEQGEFEIFREPDIASRTICFFDLDIYEEFRWDSRELYLDIGFTPLTITFTLSKAKNAKTDLLSRIVRGLNERQDLRFCPSDPRSYEYEPSPNDSFGSPLKDEEYTKAMAFTLKLLRRIAEECESIKSSPDSQISSLLALR